MWIVALAGCSFFTFDHTPCAQPQDCRDVFGFGATCGADGFCRDLKPMNRCADTWPPDLLTRPAKYADTLVFASVFDSAYDRLDQQAAQLAVMGVNGENGLDGVDFAIIQCDYNADGSTRFDTDPEDEVVARIGEWLRDEAAVPAIVGPSTSASAQAMYPSTGQRGMLMVSPSASSPALTFLDGIDHDDDNPGMMWRTVPSDAAQANAIADDLGSRGVARVAVIAVTGPYGEGLADALLAAYHDQAQVIDTYLYDETNDSALGEHVNTVVQVGYDEVVYIGSTVGAVASFMNVAASYATFEPAIFLTDAARYDALFTDSAPAARLYPQVRGTSPAAPSGPVYNSFRGAYASAFSPDSADGSIYSSYAYDAAWLVIYGTAWSNYQDRRVTGKGMARGLRQLSEGDAVSILSSNWQQVKAHFEAGRPVDLEGASGPLDFDPSTEETSNPVDLWVIEDGKFVNVGQFG